MATDIMAASTTKLTLFHSIRIRLAPSSLGAGTSPQEESSRLGEVRKSDSSSGESVLRRCQQDRSRHNFPGGPELRLGGYFSAEEDEVPEED